MFGSVGQLLLDLLHDLPEGRPVERVGVPAGPHDLVPAAEDEPEAHFTHVLQDVHSCNFILQYLASLFISFFEPM